MIKILFLAANPKETDRLRLDEVVQSIKERLGLADLRGRFEIEEEWATRFADLQASLLRHKPHVVHFIGHGSDAQGVTLEGLDGDAKPVKPAALGRLFAALKDNIRCVVLNACYSEAQAEGIADSIGCVIGMPNDIIDKAAIAFAASFYQALGYGRSIRTAFDLGLMQLEFEGLGEMSIPRLMVRPGVDASEVYPGDDESAALPQRPGQHPSCFISYSRRDKVFADNLITRLRGEDIDVWYAAGDIEGGEGITDQIEKAVHRNDRLLLVLSRHSLGSEWVKAEIGRARRAESEQGKRRLFPIRLVPYHVIRDWESSEADGGQDLASGLREYFIHDFSKWKDEAMFETAIARLITDIRVLN